jgi:hypothetical protein
MAVMVDTARRRTMAVGRMRNYVSRRTASREPRTANGGLTQMRLDWSDIREYASR